MVTAMVAIGLGFYRLVGFMAVVHYCFLIFAVGPWFAYLASECLPLGAPQLRTAAANMILLGLFVATLKFMYPFIFFQSSFTPFGTTPFCCSYYTYPHAYEKVFGW